MVRITPAMQRDPGSILELGRIPWTEGNLAGCSHGVTRGQGDDWALSMACSTETNWLERVIKPWAFKMCLICLFFFFIHLCFLFFFHASMYMCGGRMLWWGGSSDEQMHTGERTWKVHETAGLGIKVAKNPGNYVYKKHLKLSPSMILRTWWHKKKQG